ncbi:MAG TPA: flagellar basal-body rod protein FlgG [Armatimonadota bacterium]|jgi:flagellar basal-body rod protein FlgG
MMRALYTSATGMMAQQLNMDVVANNLANVNTTGFKRSRVDFQDLLYQNTREAGTTVAKGATVPTGAQTGLGVRPGAIQKMYGQGDLEQTDNPLDVTIEGDGFFQVLQPDGTTAYTRDGTLKMDATGKLVTSDGYALQPEITIPSEAKTISIGSDGTVSVTMPGQSQPQQLGQLQIARFLNPAGLNSIGRNLALPTAASGDPNVGTPGLNGFGTLAQGMIERSNVKVVEEMVNMIVAQRAYEVNSKAITTSDEMLGMANGLKR